MFDTTLPPVNHDAARAARARIDALTKPVGSLGRIEELAERLAAIHGGAPPIYARRAILIGAADHGVTREGVSAYPSEVTPQMIGAFLGGFAAINAFARTAGADVFVANFGVASELPPHERLIDVAVARGTENFALGAAMSHDAVRAALDAGARAFADVARRCDPQIVALGEMGIGNTTSAAAVVTALTGCDAEEAVGRGTGIDDETLRRKIRVVTEAVSRIGARPSWQQVASEVGGYEIVGLAGALIAAAKSRIPVVLDGFIVSAAALLAVAIEPHAVDYCIAAHRSREPGHAHALRALGLSPLLDLDLRLGEASGAALALPLCDAAARMINEMKTFAEAGVATANVPTTA